MPSFAVETNPEDNGECTNEANAVMLRSQESLLQVRCFLESVNGSPPVAPPENEQKAGMSAIDIMLANNLTIGKLMDSYNLPLDEANAEMLQLTIAEGDMTWQSVYRHRR